MVAAAVFLRLVVALPAGALSASRTTPMRTCAHLASLRPRRKWSVLKRLKLTENNLPHLSTSTLAPRELPSSPAEYNLSISLGLRSRKISGDSLATHGLLGSPMGAEGLSG